MFDAEDLPPVLPPWLNDVWQLWQLVRTQVRMSGTLDYNPAIALVASVGQTGNLWKILELLQVIEMEALRRKDNEGDPDGQ